MQRPSFVLHMHAKFPHEKTSGFARLFFALISFLSYLFTYPIDETTILICFIHPHEIPLINSL